MSDFGFVTIIMLFVGSNVFWAYLTHKLLNKLMSRSFWDYSQSKVIPKTAAQELKEALNNVKVPETRGANELDSLDEMIAKVMPLG